MLNIDEVLGPATDKNGNAEQGATVTVTNADDNTPAELFSDKEGTQPLSSNVLTTDTYGAVNAHCEGRFKVVVVGSGGRTKTRNGVVVHDPRDGVFDLYHFMTRAQIKDSRDQDGPSINLTAVWAEAVDYVWSKFVRPNQVQAAAQGFRIGVPGGAYLLDYLDLYPGMVLDCASETETRLIQSGTATRDFARILARNGYTIKGRTPRAAIQNCSLVGSGAGSALRGVACDEATSDPNYAPGLLYGSLRLDKVRLTGFSGDAVAGDAGGKRCDGSLIDVMAEACGGYGVNVTASGWSLHRPVIGGNAKEALRLAGADGAVVLLPQFGAASGTGRGAVEVDRTRSWQIHGGEIAAPVRVTGGQASQADAFYGEWMRAAIAGTTFSYKGADATDTSDGTPQAALGYLLLDNVRGLTVSAARFVPAYNRVTKQFTARPTHLVNTTGDCALSLTADLPPLKESNGTTDYGLWPCGAGANAAADLFNDATKVSALVTFAASEGSQPVRRFIGGTVDLGVAIPAGPPGPQGPQGVAGPAGAPGPAGPQGIQGPAGLDGQDGAQGIQGPAGTPGPAGATGAQGPAGATGDAGLSAYQVAVVNGFVGDELAWLASLEGPQGPQGVQGAQGVQGLQGIQGTQGPAGPAGPQGDLGPAGATGPAGPDGASAYQVAVANGFIGTEAAWLASLEGATGPTGPAGATGPQGAQGIQGPAGADGATGPQGIQGIQGPAGVDGADGAQGPAGPTGPTGATGPQGPAGSDMPAFWVDPFLSGMPMDGATVITTQAQAALTAALTTPPVGNNVGKGKSVQFREGIGITDTGLTKSGFVSIKGTGGVGSSILRLKTAPTATAETAMFKIANDGVSEGRIENQDYIEDMVLDGNRDDLSPPAFQIHGVWADAATEGRATALYRTTICNFPGAGIKIGDGRQQLRGHDFKLINNDEGMVLTNVSDAKFGMFSIGSNKYKGIEWTDCASPSAMNFDIWAPKTGFLGLYYVNVISGANVRLIQGEMQCAVRFTGDNHKPNSKAKYQWQGNVLAFVNIKVSEGAYTSPAGGANYSQLFLNEDLDSMTLAMCKFGYGLGDPTTEEVTATPPYFFNHSTQDATKLPNSLGFTRLISPLLRHKQGRVGTTDKPILAAKEKFSPDNSRLVWNTFYPGQVMEVPNNMIGINMIPADGRWVSNKDYPELYVALDTGGTRKFSDAEADFQIANRRAYPTTDGCTWVQIAWV